MKTLSTGPPEVSISASQYLIERHEKLTLKCIVKSLIPVHIEWFHNDIVVKQFYSRQVTDN